MSLNKNKVVVGLSGGVDSTASAYILKNKGYDVIGLTMRLYEEENDATVKAAKKAAEILDIEHHIVDLTNVFKEKVVDQFVNKYVKGMTPNPCVMCNKHIKYGQFIQEAKKLGAYYIATGHYIDLRYDKDSNEYKIFKHKINTKDQTYLMYSVNQDILKHLIYPLYEYDSKEEVRSLVKSLGCDIHEQKNSVGICFIKEKKHGDYILNKIKDKPKKGNFVDIEGNIIGEHKGIFNYTIGQRRGLGHTFNKPMYVLDIDVKENKVVLGDDEQTYVRGLIADEINIISECGFKDYGNLHVKVCQWGYSIDSSIEIKNGVMKVLFKDKQRSPAVGQSVVIYRDKELIGGATIRSILI